MSISFFEDDVDVAQVKAAIADKALRSAGMTYLDRLRHPKPSIRFFGAVEPFPLVKQESDGQAR